MYISSSTSPFPSNLTRSRILECGIDGDSIRGTDSPASMGAVRFRRYLFSCFSFSLKKTPCRVGV